MHTFDSLCRYPKRKNVSLSNPLTWIRRALLSQGVGPRNPLAKNRILRSVNRIAARGERERGRRAHLTCGRSAFAQGSRNRTLRAGVARGWALTAGPARDPIRGLNSCLATKKSGSGLSPLFCHGIPPMRDSGRCPGRDLSPYQNTGADLTAGGDLPIFPATSGDDSAVNRPTVSVKTSGKS